MLLTATTSTMVLLVLDSSILGVMLPTMMRDLDLSVSQSSWLVSIYLLMLLVLLLRPRGLFGERIMRFE